jgi:hypothetical protein
LSLCISIQRARLTFIWTNEEEDEEEEEEEEEQQQQLPDI